MSEKKTGKTLGWNPTYFGEPKPGSLAAVVADITNKQNDIVDEKPEVQSSAAVQAKEKATSEAAKPDFLDLDKDGNKTEPMKKAAKDAKMKKEGEHDQDSAKDMRKKNKDDAKGEKDAVKVHGEDLNAEIEKAKQGKIKSLVDTIKDMYYNTEAKQTDELTDKQKKLPPALQKAIKAKEKKDGKDDSKEID